MSIFFKIFLAISCSLVLWEIILNFTVIKTPVFKNHPFLGEIYDKGICVWGKEGYSISYVNSLGMRNREIAPKRNDEFRILLIGDSYTEGYQVDANKIFAAILEKNLNTKQKIKHINVINGGKAGNSPADYIYSANFYKKALKPDFVVIQINSNDLKECLDNPESPVYISNHNNNFRIAKKPNYISANGLRQKLPQLSFFTQFAILRVGMENIKGNGSSSDKTDTRVKASKKLPEYDPRLINWIVKNLKGSYDNSILVFLPDVDYQNGSNYELFPEEIMLTKYTKESHMDYVNMRNDFVSYRKKFTQPVIGFFNTRPGEGHINEMGHKIVADRLTEFFRGRINK